MTNKPACLNSDSQVGHMLSYAGSQGFICSEGANKREAKPNVRQPLAAHVRSFEHANPVISLFEEE